MSGEIVANAAPAKANVPAILTRKQRRLIRWTSRLGVWGVVGAFVPIIAFTVGAPVSLKMALSIMAGGFVLGGIGTALASVLVLRHAPSSVRLLKVAAGLGAPFGAALALVGIATLVGWQVVGALGGMTLSGVGVLVVVLLMASFLLDGWEHGDQTGAG